MSSERACVLPPSIWLWGISLGLANFYLWERNGWTPALPFTAEVWYLLTSGCLQQHLLLPTLGEHHGYTPCYGRMRPSTYQNPPFPLVLPWLPPAEDLGPGTKRSCSMFQVSPQSGHWGNRTQSLVWFQGYLSKRYVLLLHYIYVIHPH